MVSALCGLFRMVSHGAIAGPGAIFVASLVAACSGAAPPNADFPSDGIPAFTQVRTDAKPRRHTVPVDDDIAGRTEPWEEPIQARPPAQTASFPAPPALRSAPDFAAALGALEVDLTAPFVAPIDDNPGRLMGLDQGALRTLLGKPGFVRRDDPARMWRYRHASCVLDLFLYAETIQSSPSFRVRHVEARANGPSSASTRTCLRALLTTRAAQSTG
jgi:hypothetical protein